MFPGQSRSGVAPLPDLLRWPEPPVDRAGRRSRLHNVSPNQNSQLACRRTASRSRESGSFDQVRCARSNPSFYRQDQFSVYDKIAGRPQLPKGQGELPVVTSRASPPTHSLLCARHFFRVFRPFRGKNSSISTETAVSPGTQEFAGSATAPRSVMTIVTVAQSGPFVSGNNSCKNSAKSPSVVHLT